MRRHSSPVTKVARVFDLGLASGKLSLTKMGQDTEVHY
jgi:hypothetical protein